MRVVGRAAGKRYWRRSSPMRDSLYMSSICNTQTIFVRPAAGETCEFLMGRSVADDMRAQNIVAVTHPNFPLHDTHHKTIAHLPKDGGYQDTVAYMSEI